MIYFKRPSGEVFAYETEAQRDEFGPPDLVPMTDEEVAAHLNPPVVLPQTDPVERLRAFLAANPDVRALLS